MTTLDQQPAKLDITISIDDDFSYLVDFDISLTGYTFSANVVKKLDGSETAISIATTDLASGQITISLTDAQIAALGEDKHKWYLTWTVSGLSRRVLAGDFTIRKYPA